MLSAIQHNTSCIDIRHRNDILIKAIKESLLLFIKMEFCGKDFIILQICDY